MARRWGDPTTPSPCRRRGHPADPAEEWPAGTGSHHAAPVHGEAPEGRHLLALRCQLPGRWTSRRPTEEFWSYRACAI
jgi:hypothetical protein